MIYHFGYYGYPGVMYPKDHDNNKRVSCSFAPGMLIDNPGNPGFDYRLNRYLIRGGDGSIIETHYTESAAMAAARLRVKWKLPYSVTRLDEVEGKARETVLEKREVYSEG